MKKSSFIQFIECVTNNIIYIYIKRSNKIHLRK